MQDTFRAVRTAFYQLLHEKIVYGGAVIPVADKQTKKDDDNNFYVILSSQTSAPDYTKASYDEQVTISVDIVTKFNTSVTSDVADNIAGQLFTLLFPFSTRHLHNLPAQPGFQFLNVIKSNDQHLTLQISLTQHQIQRIIQFSLRVVY